MEYETIALVREIYRKNRWRSSKHVWENGVKWGERKRERDREKLF
jgi:hypothetical protein